MRTIEYFTESEIPYGTLAKFGLTREMIESLPEPVMSRLLSSRTTPVLPLVVEDNGKQVRCQGKIALVRKDGKVDVIFNPVWETNELESFTPDEQGRLKNGEVVYADVMDKGKCFVQFDSELNKCMFVPGLIIDQNIDCLSESDAVDEKSILQEKSSEKLITVLILKRIEAFTTEHLHINKIPALPCVLELLVHHVRADMDVRVVVHLVHLAKAVRFAKVDLPLIVSKPRTLVKNITHPRLSRPNFLLICLEE